MAIEPAADQPTHYYSLNNEDFNYENMGDALDNAEVGDYAYEGDGIHPKPSDFFSIDWLLEDLGQRANDENGEYADDFPGATPEVAKAIEIEIGHILDKYLTCDFWKIIRSRKFLITKEVIEGADPEYIEEEIKA